MTEHATPTSASDAAHRGTQFVLLHGGWHGGWSYARVIERLVAAGHVAVAPDLPGHGLRARWPAAATNGARSAVAHVQLDDYVEAVLPLLAALRSAGARRIVLVGHSMAGIVLNAIGERAPDQVDALVYLAAHLPGDGQAAGPYFGLPEAGGTRLGEAFTGDPAALGAFRIDARQGTALDAIRDAFYNDASDADFDAARQLMTPDLPLAPMLAPLPLSAARWGRLERHYIVCERDRSVPPALARRFVADGDAVAPDRPVRVHRLDSGHSPFVTAPEALTALLLGIASG